MSDDFSAMLAVAREAGDLAASRQDEGFDHWEKQPGDPVSEVDLHLDAMIKHRLRNLRPAYGWLSEETVDDPARLACQKVWVVDPIDGTRAYLAGADGFAVSIALVDAGQPVLACLYAPARHMMFAAELGKGATLNGLPIRASRVSEIEDCRMVANADLFRAKHWPEPWPAMRLDMVNSIALRIGLVAAGLADVAIALRPKNEWDLAAATLILTESGGLMSDHAGLPPKFNQPDPVIETLVAAGPRLHEPVRLRVAAGIKRWRER